MIVSFYICEKRPVNQNGLPVKQEYERPFQPAKATRVHDSEILRTIVNNIFITPS